jgi:hypothetical protein
MLCHGVVLTSVAGRSGHASTGEYVWKFPTSLSIVARGALSVGQIRSGEVSKKNLV